MPTPSDPKPAPEEIAREAAGVIASAPGYGPLRPVEYAKELPPRAAALASVLMDEKIVEAAGRYQTCDAAAGKAQQRFKHWGWLAAYSGFLAAGLGGGLLYLGPEPSMAWARSNLGLAQSILLGLSLAFAFLLYALKPYRKWRVQRGDAEAKRLQVFALIQVFALMMSAPRNCSGRRPSPPPSPVGVLSAPPLLRPARILRAQRLAATPDRVHLEGCRVHCAPARSGIRHSAIVAAGSGGIAAGGGAEVHRGAAAGGEALCSGWAHRRRAAGSPCSVDCHVAGRTQCSQVQGNAQAAGQVHRRPGRRRTQRRGAGRSRSRQRVCRPGHGRSRG